MSFTHFNKVNSFKMELTWCNNYPKNKYAWCKWSHPNQMKGTCQYQSQFYSQPSGNVVFRCWNDEFDKSFYNILIRIQYQIQPKFHKFCNLVALHFFRLLFANVLFELTVFILIANVGWSMSSAIAIYKINTTKT